jgi:hypothetical protein
LTEPVVSKHCIACRKNISNDRRFRAKNGQYLCLPCWDKVKIAAAAAKGLPVDSQAAEIVLPQRQRAVAGAGGPQGQDSRAGDSKLNDSKLHDTKLHDTRFHDSRLGGTRSGTNSGTNAAGLTGTHADPGGSTVSDFLDGAASLVFELGTDTSVQNTLACPSCREPWSLDAVVCLNCGYKRDAFKQKSSAHAPKKPRSWVWHVAPRFIHLQAERANRFAFFAAIVGALLGISFWAATSSATGIRAEFMAIVVGITAGLAVSFGVNRLADRTTGLAAAAVTALATLPGHYFAGTFILGRQGLERLPAKEWLPQIVTPWSGLFCVLGIWLAFRFGKSLPKIPMKRKSILVEDPTTTS